MKIKLNNLRTLVLSKISRAAEKGDLDKVNSLSSKVSKLKELITAYERLEEAVEQVEQDIEESENTASTGIAKTLNPPKKEIGKPYNGHYLRKGRKEQKSLAIEIDWSRNGQPYGKETIKRPKGSDSLKHLIIRLVEIYGLEILDKASEFEISRGPIVSKNPDRDYSYNSSGTKKLYGNQPIPGTRYHVLTHSSTEEKIGFLGNFLRFLNLAPGSFTVREYSLEELRGL